MHEGGGADIRANRSAAQGHEWRRILAGGIDERRLQLLGRHGQSCRSLDHLAQRSFRHRRVEGRLARDAGHPRLDLEAGIGHRSGCTRWPADAHWFRVPWSTARFRTCQSLRKAQHIRPNSSLPCAGASRWHPARAARPAGRSAADFDVAGAVSQGWDGAGCPEKADRSLWLAGATKSGKVLRGAALLVSGLGVSTGESCNSARAHLSHGGPRPLPGGRSTPPAGARSVPCVRRRGRWVLAD